MRHHASSHRKKRLVLPVNGYLLWKSHNRSHVHGQAFHLVSVPSGSTNRPANTANCKLNSAGFSTSMCTCVSACARSFNRSGPGLTKVASTSRVTCIKSDSTVSRHMYQCRHTILTFRLRHLSPHSTTRSTRSAAGFIGLLQLISRAQICSTSTYPHIATHPEPTTTVYFSPSCLPLFAYMSRMARKARNIFCQINISTPGGTTLL